MAKQQGKASHRQLCGREEAASGKEAHGINQQVSCTLAHLSLPMRQCMPRIGSYHADTAAAGGPG